MGLFNKLKDALFEEETVEIPVITKKEKVKEPKKEEKKKVEPIKLSKEEKEPTEEIKITKMKPTENTGVIDMPKLKSETKEEPKRSVASSLTFPVFDDEEEDEIEIKEIKRTPTKQIVKQVEPPRKTTSRNLLQDDFYDYTDVHNRVSTFKSKSATRRQSESTHFTPSPIISPVYGILNEDYKKEDIVTRGEKKKSSYEKLDLDEVRKKAYGTLEDDIEKTLTKIDIEEPKEEPKDVGASKLKDDGISIDDLLTDKNDMTIGEAFEAEKEIDLDDEIREIDEDIEETPTYEEPKEEKIEEVEEKEIKKEEADGEDDLFDLIDSLYAGKGE